jgi:hypothetical protein
MRVLAATPHTAAAFSADVLRRIFSVAVFALHLFKRLRFTID